MAALQQPEPTKDQGSLGILLFCGENTLGILHLAPVSSISTEVELGESAGKILWEIKSWFIMIFNFSYIYVFNLIEPQKNCNLFCPLCSLLVLPFLGGFCVGWFGAFCLLFLFYPFLSMGYRHKFHVAVKLLLLK